MRQYTDTFSQKVSKLRMTACVLPFFSIFFKDDRAINLLSKRRWPKKPNKRRKIQPSLLRWAAHYLETWYEEFIVTMPDSTFIALQNTWLRYIKAVLYQCCTHFDTELMSELVFSWTMKDISQRSEFFLSNGAFWAQNFRQLELVISASFPTARTRH